jgi:hypothetical protein
MRNTVPVDLSGLIVPPFGNRLAFPQESYGDRPSFGRQRDPEPPYNLGLWGGPPRKIGVSLRRRARIQIFRLEGLPQGQPLLGLQAVERDGVRVQTGSEPRFLPHLGDCY